MVDVDWRLIAQKQQEDNYSELQKIADLDQEIATQTGPLDFQPPVTPTPYAGPSLVSNTLSPEERIQSEVKGLEETARARQGERDTNVFEQFTGGVIRPFEQTTSGLLALSGMGLEKAGAEELGQNLQELAGDPEKSNLSAYQTPSDELSTSQSIGRGLGTAVGYVGEFLAGSKGTGAILEKGLLKTGGKEATEEAAQKILLKEGVEQLATKQGKKAFQKKIKKELAKRGAINAGIIEGATFGGLEFLKSRGDPVDTAIAATIGGVFPQISNKASPFIKKELGKATQSIKAAVPNVKQFVSDTLQPVLNLGVKSDEYSAAKVLNSIDDKELPGIMNSLKNEIGGIKLGKPVKYSADKVIKKGTSRPELPTLDELKFKAKKEFIDRFVAIEDIEKVAASKAGIKKFAAKESPYTAFRLQAGIGGKLDNIAEDFTGLLQGINKNVRDDLAVYLVAKRDLHIASQKGIKTSLTKPEALKDILLLKKKYGNDFDKLHGLAENIWGFNREQLKKKLSSGIIDNRQYQTLIKSEPFYYPIEVTKYQDKVLRRLGGKSFTPKDNIGGLTGRGKGQEIADPLEASLRNAFDSEAQSQKNIAMSKLIGLRNSSEEMAQLIKPFTGEKRKLASGFDTIKLYQNGQEVKYAVPQEIANAVKGLDEFQSDFITQTMGRLTGLFRAGTTGSNILFVIPNAIRDFSTAALTEGMTFSQWLRAAGVNAKALVGKTPKDLRLFRESGAGFGGYAGQIRDIGRQSRLIDDATKTFTERFSRTITRPTELIKKPFELINAFSEVIENTPRLAVFRSKLAKGLSTEEAALAARNATVDFSRMGNAMRLFNMFVPFVNARLQGNLNVVKALGGALKGENSARVAAVVGGYVLAPAMAAWAYNRHYHSDLYDQIPEWSKENYFNIIIGTTEDDNGDTQPLWVKIPKPEVAKIFGNTTEDMLENLYRNQKLDPQKMLVQAVGTLSPIDFERDGEFDLRKAAGSVTPPFMKSTLEAISGERGFNLFTGREIEPRTIEGVKTEDLPEEYRFTDRTTDFAKFVGKDLGLSKALKLSPIKIDHIVRGMFGEVGTILTDPSQLTERGKRRFIGTYGNAETDRNYKFLQQAKREGAVKKLKLNQDVKKFFEEAKDLEPKEIIQRLKDKPEMLDKVKREIKKRKQALTSFERSLKVAGVSDGTRAKTMYLILKHTPPKEAKDKMIRWATAGKTKRGKAILTKDVLKQLVQLVSEDEELSQRLKSIRENQGALSNVR